jgi:hypothetical protein
MQNRNIINDINQIEFLLNNLHVQFINVGFIYKFRLPQLNIMYMYENKWKLLKYTNFHKRLHLTPIFKGNDISQFQIIINTLNIYDRYLLLKKITDITDLQYEIINKFY